MRLLYPPPAPEPPPMTRAESLPSSMPFSVWRRRFPHGDHPPITAVLLVAFDHDHGPAVEACFPHDVLSQPQREFVAVHALPDSAAASAGREDAFYVLRVPPADDRETLCLAHVLFRQAPAPGSKRGAFQKAVVFLCDNPVLSLPHAVLELVEDLVFSEGADALHRVWQHVSSWPSLRSHAGEEILLELVERKLTVSVPQSFARSFAAPTVTTGPSKSPEFRIEDGSPTGVAAITRNGSLMHENSSRSSVLVRRLPLSLPSAQPTAAPFHEVCVARALRGACDKIWTLWELVALGEPVLVRASTPSHAAAAVLALVGLVHPLPFVGDWRPYFSIQDPSYVPLCRARDVRQFCRDGAVYGVTNVLMVDSMRFPHVLTIAAAEGVGKTLKPGLETTHRGSLHKSRTLINTLAAARKEGRSGLSQSMDVRACVFEKITRPFLRAFDRYLVPTWGNGKSVTVEPYASDPFGRMLSLLDLNLNTFPSPEDLASPGLMALFRSGAISKNRVRTLYARFAGGPVFQAWWKEARVAAERECIVLHRTDVIEACVRGTGIVSRQIHKDDPADAPLVDRVIDLYLRVREEMSRAAEDDMVLREKLSMLLESLVRPLPEEVRLTMRLSVS